jgi:hypothetical protein
MASSLQPLAAILALELVFLVAFEFNILLKININGTLHFLNSNI